VTDDGNRYDCLEEYIGLVQAKRIHDAAIKRRNDLMEQLVTAESNAVNSYLEIESIQSMQIERIQRDRQEQWQEEHEAIIATINHVVTGEAGEVAVIGFTAQKALIEHDCDKDWKTCECALKYCHCDALPSDM